MAKPSPFYQVSTRVRANIGTQSTFSQQVNMRPVRKNSPRKTIPIRSRSERIAAWIDNAPTKKILVAAIAVVAFILSVANAIWSGYKEYQLVTLQPTIEIRSRTSYPIWTPVAMDQLIGGSFSNTPPTALPRISAPYFPVVLSVHNPTTKKTTIADCSLRIRFYKRSEEYESLGYLTENSLKSGTPQDEPLVNLDAGSTSRVKWLFFFLPTPELEVVLKDKTTQAFRFQAVCRDESKREILSAWR